MQAARHIVHVAGLYLILAASPAAAEPDDRASLPAVDGFNAKISGFGGAAEERAIYGGAGSVTPL